MKAGRMRDRLELMKPEVSVNRYGEEATTYTVTAVGGTTVTETIEIICK